MNKIFYFYVTSVFYIHTSNYTCDAVYTKYISHFGISIGVNGTLHQTSPYISLACNSSALNIYLIVRGRTRHWFLLINSHDVEKYDKWCISFCWLVPGVRIVYNV